MKNTKKDKAHTNPPMISDKLISVFTKIHSNPGFTKKNAFDIFSKVSRSKIKKTQ